MNKPITLGSYQNIQPSYPLFPKADKLTFGITSDLALFPRQQQDDKFNPSGMVGKGKDPAGYGIADISDVFNGQERRFSKRPVALSNDEYMARQTGIPQHIYRLFRERTNQARRSIPEDIRPLDQQRGSNYITQFGEEAEIPYSDILQRTTPHFYHNPATKDIPLTTVPKKYTLRTGLNGLLMDVVPDSIITQLAQYNGLGDETKDKTKQQQLRTRLAMERGALGDQLFQMDTAKHELAHANTKQYTPKWNSGLVGGNVESYESLAPTGSFGQLTYFGTMPAEAWGAANRIKNDGAGLFYKKNGRLPGFDPYGNKLNVQDSEKDISEAVDMFFNNNPGKNTVEHQRIKNQLLKPDGADLIKKWFLLAPESLGVPSEDPTVRMWDLAHRNSGRMNKVAAANINGLYKAASEAK